MPWVVMVEAILSGPTDSERVARGDATQLDDREETLGGG